MVRWWPPAVVVALSLAACDASSSSAELALTAADCTAADFSEVSVLSIEVYGAHAGDLCVLRQRCIFNVDAASVDDLADAMRSVSQPLIDVEADGAMVLAVLGHTTTCFGYDDQVLCGLADLADADDGILDVALSCQPCPEDEIPFCP